MSGRVAARVAAVLAACFMAVAVANVLGAESSLVVWTQAARGLGEQEPGSPHYMILVLGAIVWTLIAVAFLGRGGEGPLRNAPSRLVAVICWYAVVASALSILSSLGVLVLGWSLVPRVGEALFVGFGVTALVKTGRRLTTSGPPVADRGAGRAASSSEGATRRSAG